MDVWDPAKFLEWRLYLKKNHQAASKFSNQFVFFNKHLTCLSLFHYYCYYYWFKPFFAIFPFPAISVLYFLLHYPWDAFPGFLIYSFLQFSSYLLRFLCLPGSQSNIYFKHVSLFLSYQIKLCLVWYVELALSLLFFFPLFPVLIFH